MANFNVVNKKIILMVIFILVSLPVFSAKLFYLSTDRTFSENEIKRVKVESGFLDEVEIRVYKIEDTRKYFLSQEDFHRPKVAGRKFRYATPQVIKGFKNYLKSNLRTWARQNMPAENRDTILEEHKNLSTNNDERYFNPSKKVDYITDENFSLVNENRYVFERKNSEWNTNYIYFNHLKPGTYLIEGITGDNLAYTVLNVSKFSFITKKAGDQLNLYAVSSGTGEPLENIEFTIYDRFRNKIAQDSTNSNGITNFELVEDDMLIYAQDNKGSYSFYDPRYYPSSLTNKKVYLYTDRPVYKGGDDVNIKGIVNEKDYIVTTLDIFNDNGMVLKDIDIIKNSTGSFHASFKLPSDSPSGNYRVLTTVNDKIYESEFKVEYYVKPEFKLSVKPEKTTYLPGEQVRFKVNADYYYGESVPNIDIKYVISRSRYNFKNIDRDELGSYLSAQEWSYTGVERLSNDSFKLDENGEGYISFFVEGKDLPDDNPYTYRVMATAINESGENITSSGSTRVVPSNLRFSLSTHKFVYEKGEKISLIIDVSDYDNNKLSKKLTIDTYTQENGIKTALSNDKIDSDKDGFAQFDFTANEPGLVFFEISSKDDKGNISINKKSVWIGEEGAAYSVSGGFVQLVLDKKYYSTSDTAKLLIVSPISDIPMLLTIEGEKIYSSKVIRLNKNSSVVEIPVDKNYLPNAFITLDFIYENRHYSNSIKLDVPPIEQFLNIKVIADKESYRPNSRDKFRLKVTDNLGNPVKGADLSIAIVDEAIYGISEDLTVDIRKFFYHFRRNNVMTWTSSGFRFYGYAYNVKRELASEFYRDATGIASFKGDDEEEEKERKDFKDVILWLPSIITDNKGEYEFYVDFPGNITSWRFTTIGIDNKNRVGVARENVITKKDIFTTLSVSKTIGEFDKSSVYISVTNDSNTKKTLKVTTELENFSGDIINKTITVDAKSNVVIKQDITPKSDKDGFIKVFIFEGDTKLDEVSKSITTTKFSIQKSFVVSHKVNKDNPKFDFNIPSDMNQGASQVTLTMVDGITGHIFDSLDYLSTYPFGCVEQTTNKFLPNISIAQAFNNAEIPLNKSEEELRKNIDEGVFKLSGFQNENGSWGWWNGAENDIFMSSYVLYGLTMVQQLYSSVNYKVIDSAIEYLKDNIHYSELTDKLFGLYVLSLNGISIDSIYKSINPENLNDYQAALYILIATNYSYTGIAKENARVLFDRYKPDGETIYWGEKKSTNWVTDHIETTAWVIKALNPYIPYSELLNGVNYLINNKNGNKWSSTRDTSAAVIALSEFISEDDKKGIKIKANLNKKYVSEFDLTNKSYRVKNIIPINQIKDVNNISITGLQDNFYTAILNIKYYTSGNNILSSSSGSQVSKKYYKLNSDMTIGDESKEFTKGDNIMVVIEYKQDNIGEYIMLTDHLPAGTSYNSDLNQFTVTGIDTSFPDFIDSRYDKIHFFFSDPGNKKVLYALKATYPGVYKVNPAVGELMYYPEVTGNSESDIIKINEAVK